MLSIRVIIEGKSRNDYLQTSSYRSFCRVEEDKIDEQKVGAADESVERQGQDDYRTTWFPVLSVGREAALDVQEQQA